MGGFDRLFWKKNRCTVRMFRISMGGFDGAVLLVVPLADLSG